MTTDLTVAVEGHRLRVPLSELEFQFSRSSGPGGQNVNKVNSRAMLRWNPARNTSLPDEVRGRLLQRVAPRLTRQGELVITSQRFRDQGRNIADCLEKLRGLMASVATSPKVRRPTKPTAGAQRRRRAAKQTRKALKQQRRSIAPNRDLD